MSEGRVAIAIIGWDKYNAMKWSNVRWDGDRMAWVSQTSQKIFAQEWVSDHTIEDVEAASREVLKPGDFRVHFYQVLDHRRIQEIADRYEWKVF